MTLDRDPQDPVTIMAELDAAAQELNDLSNRLGQIEMALEPVELEYEEFMASYEEGLWALHLEGGKWPAEALRTRLGHRAMDADLLGRYMALVNRRKRIEKRIASLGKVVNAKQSILSALKEAGRVDGSGLRRAA